MPRPRPPEKLRTYAVRLTQRQWAKVQELGGAAFLRKLIATHNPALAARMDRTVRMENGQLIEA